MGGVPLGRVTREEAHRRIREKEARGVGFRGHRGKQEFRAIEMVNAQIDCRVPGGKSLVYSEDLGDHHHVLTLMRPGAGGEYVRWHPGLTFKDLRAGRMTPEPVRKVRR